MTDHQLSKSDALDYILAGKAIFTVQNDDTGNRFTFKVKAKRGTTDLFYVSVLSGPSNTSDYTYIGSINKGSFGLTPASRVNQQAQSFRVFAYLFDRLRNGTLPLSIKVYHSNHCGRCGRLLTVSSSIISGIGPECQRMISKTRQTRIAW